jgi:predicted AAA+ superfamily ATPase
MKICDNLLQVASDYYKFAVYCSIWIIFLHLAHREPDNKFYAFDAGAYATLVGTLGLLAEAFIAAHLRRRMR